MKNPWSEYPRHGHKGSRPLIDTGDREGYEEIRDGALWLAGKIASPFKALGRKLKRKKKYSDLDYR